MLEVFKEQAAKSNGLRVIVSQQTILYFSTEMEMLIIT
jgi:hypothetical protein